MPWRLIDPKTSPRARRFAHIVAGVATGLILVGGVIAVVTGVYLINAVRETQIANTERSALDRQRDEKTADTAADAARAAERIEDCTTPGQPCFEDAQRRRNESVNSINRYALAAAACADAPQQQTIDELEDCILEEITQPRPPRTQQ